MACEVLRVASFNIARVTALGVVFALADAWILGLLLGVEFLLFTVIKMNNFWYFQRTVPRFASLIFHVAQFVPLQAAPANSLRMPWFMGPRVMEYLSNYIAVMNLILIAVVLRGALPPPRDA